MSNLKRYSQSRNFRVGLRAAHRESGYKGLLVAILGKENVEERKKDETKES